MEGNLQKWTNYISTWKERYFVLTGVVLCYYKKRGEAARGKIHMGIATVRDGEDLKFEIDTGVSVIFLQAPDRDSKIAWLQALKKAKVEADKIKLKLQNQNSLNMNPATVKKINSLIEDMQMNNDILKQMGEEFNELKMESDKDSIFSLDNFLRVIKNNEKALDEMNKLINHKPQFNLPLNNDSDPSNPKLPKSVKAASSNRIAFPSDIDDNTIQSSKGSNQIVKVDPDSDPEENDHKHNNSKIYNDYKQIVKKNSEVFYEVDDDLENLLKDIDKDDGEIKLKPNLKKIPDKTEKNIQKQSALYEPAYKEVRHKLPRERVKLNLSVWSILKDAVGKDLNKFAIPVYFNEPLSMLQRLCENFQYAKLLNRAALEQNPYIRLALIGAFGISAFSLNPKRTLKFFNPLLGETYEYVDNEMHFRYFAEQVSHHPAISACHAEGENWVYYGNTNLKSQFKLMKSMLEFHPISRIYITLKTFDEQISMSKPIATARNLLSNVFVDCYGKFTVNNHSTGDYCDFELFEAASNQQGQGELKGEVFDMQGNLKLKVKGNWLGEISVEGVDEYANVKETIWVRNKAGDEEGRFFFTDFVCNLNNLSEELKEILPPTDSRFRPDQRALENQDLDLANKEKLRLEEKQRTKRKELEKKKQKQKPMYFNETYDDSTGDLIYLYTRDYWKDRKEKNFSHFPDIYSNN
jgi:hypothetical protein